MMLRVAKAIYDSKTQVLDADDISRKTGTPVNDVLATVKKGIDFRPQLFMKSGYEEFTLASYLQNLFDAAFKTENAEAMKLLNKLESEFEGPQNETQAETIEEVTAKPEEHELRTQEKKLTIFEPHQCMVLDLLYEHAELYTRDSSRVVQYDYQYKIYEVKLGRGNYPVFLIVPPYVNLPLGFTELLIEHLDSEDPFDELHLDWPDESARYRMFTSHAFFVNRKEKTTPEICWQKLLQKNQDKLVFATLASPINRQELDMELKGWSKEKMDQLVDDYLKADGWIVDPMLRYLYRADKVKITKGKLRPYDVMKYQPHKIVVTNTKVGKTSMAKRNGIVLDRVTGARFLGFSTAKDVCPGLGNGLLDPTYFDEVGSLTQIIVDHILNYLEFGEARIEVGKMGIDTKGWSLCTFHSNPEVPTDDPSHLMIGLQSFLQKFSTRLDAIGSRIAIILFTTKLERARKEPGRRTSVQQMETKVMFETILEMAQPNIEKLFADEKIIEWLETPIDQYELSMKMLMDKNEATIPDAIKQLYISHREGCHRHLRGFAFKQAVVDHLREIYFGEVDIDTFLETCEEHVAKACKINMDSLVRMCSAGFSVPEEYKVELSRIPAYSRGIVVAYHLWKEEHPEQELAPLDELGPIWEKFYHGIDQEKVPKEIEVAQYDYFSKIIDRLSRTELNSLNQKMSPFGIELFLHTNNFLMIRPTKIESLISRISQILKMEKGEKGNEGENFSVSQISLFLNGLYKGELLSMV